MQKSDAGEQLGVQGMWQVFLFCFCFFCLFVCLFLLQKFRAAVLKLYESEHGLTTERLKIFLFKRFLFYFSCTSLT